MACIWKEPHDSVKHRDVPSEYSSNADNHLRAPGLIPEDVAMVHVASFTFQSGFPSRTLIQPGGCAFLLRWRHNRRHGVFPAAVGERMLIGTVGLHDENLRKGLERIVIERRFILEPIARAGPQNVFTVRGPGRVAVVARRGGQLFGVRAIGAHRENVIIMPLRRTATEQYSVNAEAE